MKKTILKTKKTDVLVEFLTTSVHPFWVNPIYCDKQEVGLLTYTSLTSPKKRAKELEQIVAQLNGKSKKNYLHNLFSGIVGRNVRILSIELRDSHSYCNQKTIVISLKID